MQRLAVLGTSFFGGGFLATLLFMQWDPDDFVRLDDLAEQLAHPFQTPEITTFFLGITSLGDKMTIIIVTLLVLLYLSKERVLLGRLALGLVGTTASVAVVKTLIERVRPPALPWLGELHSYSFPSGHAASAMMLYGFIAIVLISRATTLRLKLGIGIGAGILITLIGASRVVLAAHYGSDVLSGFFLGGFWLSLVFIFRVKNKFETPIIRTVH
jgi:undecaprenyl-diphosphatase